MQSLDVLFFHRIAQTRKTCAMCNICSNHNIDWKFKSEQTEISVKYASQWYKIKSLSCWKQNILGMLWIPWLLMPWLLASPGHQHTWHCIYRINRSLRLPLRDFNCLHHTCWEKIKNAYIFFMSPKVNSGLRGSCEMSPGGCLNKKMSSYQYKYPPC